MIYITRSRGSGFYAQKQVTVSGSPPAQLTDAITNQFPLSLNELAPIPNFEKTSRDKVAEYTRTHCPYDEDFKTKNPSKRKKKNIRSSVQRRKR